MFLTANEYTSAIGPEERSKIRSRLISSGMNENQDKLANLNAIALAKVARSDYPSNWPNLLDDIMQLLQQSVQPNAPPKQLSRVLLITHHLIKELATIRLNRGIANLRHLSPSLFNVLKELYTYRFQQWQALLSTSPSELNMQALNYMNDNEKILKIVRRLLCAGYEYIHRDEAVHDFWRLTTSHVQLYIQLLHQEGVHSAYQLSAGRHAKQLAKLHVNVAQDHGVSFALMPDAAALTRHYWESAKTLRQRQITSPDDITDDYVTMYDGYNLRALLLLRACIALAWATQTGNFRYNKNPETKDDPSIARELIKIELLADAFILELYDNVIHFFFYYLQSDIEEFTTEPEEWEMKEGHDGDSFERSVRPCAERLFLDVTLHYKDLIIEPLLAKLSIMCGMSCYQCLADVMLTVLDPSQQNVLIKDAAYSAIGVAAPMLHQKLDFNGFFTGTIVPELQRSGENQAVLRRRIAILLAQWISLDISEANRPVIYQIYQHLLDRSVLLNDETVRITAAKRFADVAVAWEFDAAQFSQFSKQTLSSILELIQEVSMVETKLALLHTVGTVIEAMGFNVLESAEDIISILPRLWTENESENLMKAAIVSVLAKLVKSMRHESVRIHHVMLPTIKMAMDPTSESQIYLLEDSLDLWQSIMRQTPVSGISDDLLTMFPLIFPTFEMETEYIKSGLRITQSYALLSPSTLLHDSIRLPLFTQFCTLLDVRRTDIIDDLCGTLETLITGASALGGASAIQVVVSALMDANTRMLDSLHSNYDTHQTTGPNRKDPPQDWKNETQYLLILARILIVDSNIFLSIVDIWARSRNRDTETALIEVLDEWFANMDAVSAPAKKKLLVLAVTKLLETGATWILSRLQELMALWTSISTELRDESKGPLSDSLVVEPRNGDEPAEEMEGPEDKRRREAIFGDVSRTVNVNEFVKWHLNRAIEASGGGQAFQERWVGDVDKEIVKGFEETGIMNG
jgi:hypothetical protein